MEGRAATVNSFPFQLGEGGGDVTGIVVIEQQPILPLSEPDRLHCTLQTT